ncbi:3-dehydroquinate synthase II [Plantactinospora sp. S1510]|uniref:3-dehydroquinate synthase II n=1 Tax=Plantactinospora alkalitolerans TaxID=2789879 RepID=A0ABS0H8G0_9ACTN|nr:3-dehydroquinate synthase II [Plantactinospora alkalitolerans]MBF9134468.1 3-dehydroquinate synthase II [Plantactinospora alkalitolerans]
MRLCWLDVRRAEENRKAILEEAVHQRMDAVVSDVPDDLSGLPPTLTRVYFSLDQPLPPDFDGIDVLILDVRSGVRPADVLREHPDLEVGRYVEITDSATLERACDIARTDTWSVLHFHDPTKIPLEIVLAAADRTDGSIVTMVADPAEAEIVFGVLERGSDGVMMAATDVGDTTRLRTAAQSHVADVELVELTVTAVSDVGMGDRVCVDTCSHFREDEGLLIGSHARGMVLCCSETHPLPYMPTRPFRVNAGALHSYTLAHAERTSYLSELTSGGRVLAVDSAGRTRLVTVGRVKIETRPLLSIDAVAPSGQPVNLIVQHDWHVRVLGPGGQVLNTTELRPGDRVLGFLPVEARHVGYAINEFCLEK